MTQPHEFESSVDAFAVHLEHFDGPLDLLMHLIKKHEVNIYDIPIATITTQYLDVIELMHELNLDVAGDFLVMAATLIHLKSRTLLPRPETSATVDGDEEDPRDALVRRLVEHQRFKAAAELLHEREQVRAAQWQRPDERVAALAGDDYEPELEVDLFSLLNAFQSVLQRLKKRPKPFLPAEQVPIEVRIDQLLERLSETEACGFEDLFGDVQDRSGLIVTFLALLEMIRLKLVRVFQSGSFGPIRVYNARGRPMLRIQLATRRHIVGDEEQAQQEQVSDAPVGDDRQVSDADAGRETATAEAAVVDDADDADAAGAADADVLEPEMSGESVAVTDTAGDEDGSSPQELAAAPADAPALDDDGTPFVRSAELKSIVEALIFASPEPLSLKALYKLLDAEPREDVDAAVLALKSDYERPGGLQLVEIAGGFQIVTRPDLHEWVRRLFHERSTQKLSVQALETLAVIAYRQPITAAEITEIRGVNTSGVINTLLERHLVKIVGRKAVVGRPFMYATTREFLIRFGLNDIADLPKVQDMVDALGLESPLLVERMTSDEQLPLDEPDNEVPEPAPPLSDSVD